MKIMLFIVMGLVPILALAQDYNSMRIPDSLKTNANVIKRYEERIIEIKSPGKAIEKERHVYTILNEEADKYGSYTSFYNKFTAIDYISGTLYDAWGKSLKHIKKKDMEDRSVFDGFSLMTDSRYKTADFYCRNYPYSVEFEEQDNIDGILNLDSWFPANAPGMAVEYSKYVIIMPKDYQIRYKSLNCTIPPVITETADKKTYTWEIKNIPAKFTESLGPSWSEIAPRVLIGPTDFEAEGYKGNMNSWSSYGKFIYDLQKGRDVLPDDIKRTVHELTDHLKNEKQKISVLYEFMQKNTHYISIQLGIGGWQPFDASYVATKRYGDCKALSNYMVALLKEAGINGNTVDIRAGAGASEIIKDFPSFQFNHEIACVPMNNDTVWLECTSQTLPAGYLSSFTADRYAILVNEKGGTLVRTPKYGLTDNLEIRKVNASINEEGNLTAAITTNYRGLRQDRLEQLITGLSKDKMLEYLKSEINLPTYDISSFNYIQQKEIYPPAITESLSVDAANYAQVSGKRLFIVPNILSRSDTKYKQNDNRKYGIELHDEYRLIDTTEIKIPVGYQRESVPAEMKILNKFGKYYSTIKIEAGKITYIRTLDHYSGRFSAADYSDLVNFYEAIYKADHARIVLVKKD